MTHPNLLNYLSIESPDATRPKFHKRHYEDIASLFKKILNKRMYVVYTHELMQMFIEHFEADNPTFKRERFLKAVLK